MTATIVLCGVGIGQIDSARAGSVVPRNAVAVVNGGTLTRTTFIHWMRVAVKGANATARKGTPEIVPTDPPAFRGCIAQVRAQLPKLASTSTAKIRSDCRALFTSLSAQVLSFLIESDWYEADAAIDHITITSAQVASALKTDRQKQFPTSAAYRAFLRLTGQTNRDIVFRVRINLIYEALLKQAHGSSRSVLSDARKQFLPTTSCARYYVMSDCANYAGNRRVAGVSRVAAREAGSAAAPGMPGRRRP